MAVLWSPGRDVDAAEKSLRVVDDLRALSLPSLSVPAQQSRLLRRGCVRTDMWRRSPCGSGLAAQAPAVERDDDVVAHDGPHTARTKVGVRRLQELPLARRRAGTATVGYG